MWFQVNSRPTSLFLLNYMSNSSFLWVSTTVFVTSTCRPTSSFTRYDTVTTTALTFFVCMKCNFLQMTNPQSLPCNIFHSSNLHFWENCYHPNPAYLGDTSGISNSSGIHVSNRIVARQHYIDNNFLSRIRLCANFRVLHHHELVSLHRFTWQIREILQALVISIHVRNI